MPNSDRHDREMYVSLTKEPDNMDTTSRDFDFFSETCSCHRVLRFSFGHVFSNVFVLQNDLH